jgi:hypothetical protein
MAAAKGKGKTLKQHRAWTDEEVLQVLTAQGYITLCELGRPEFVGLRPLVDDWWEARVRHAVAKAPDRLDRARERLIAAARKIEQTKIEWSEGPQSPAVRERLISETRAAHVIPLAPEARARRRGPRDPG